MKLINIWITYACNLRCTYCYEGAVKKKGYLTIEKCNAIIEYIRKSYELQDELSVNFHGGEPFLCTSVIEYLCEKIEYIMGNKIHFSVTTNGTLLDVEEIKIIKKHRIDVTLSIDGMEHSHNNSRKYGNGNGSFDDCLHGALLLQKNDIPFKCRMTLTPGNYIYLENNVDYLNEMFNCDILAVPDLYEKSWTENNMKEIENIVKRLSKKSRLGFYFYVKCIKNRGKCRGGEDELNITPSLDLYPCACVVGNRDFCLGNIGTGEINPKAYQYIESINEQEMPECDGCMHSEFCTSYRCRMYNLTITGESNVASGVMCRCENIVYRMFNEGVWK